MKNNYLMSSMYLLVLSILIFILSLYFIKVNLVMMLEWEIMMINSMEFKMVILLDWMSMMFMSFVLFISFVVVVYSNDYMEMDENKSRFLLLVLLFVFSMMLLIVSPNLISILLGWDGLGLVSYCLVIYYQNNKSYNAGMLTVLVNRIGDVMLLLSISWMLSYGSFNYMFYMKYMIDNLEIMMISILLMISAMTKSAQVPFSSWLPAAMAAPTPVSALVHSSTLVTAGVYLMIRFNSLIMESNLNMILLLLASITMFMSGMSANFEFDLKKIIALSTLSQLGLMMSSLSMGMNNMAYFHMLMHALFKAMLFMCAGMIIHVMNNYQDIRYMGGMSNLLPLLGCFMSIANLALCGFPFLSGFYSKDFILEMVSFSNFNMMIYMMFYVSVGLTVCYSVRMTVIMFMLMLNYFSLNLINENFNKMMVMSYLLLLLSLIMGKLISMMIFIPYNYFIMFPLKLMVMLFLLMGLWIGMMISNNKFYYKLNFNNKIMLFLGNMWFLLKIYYFLNYFIIYMNYYNKFIDQGWLEFYGSQQIYDYYKYNSITYMKYQNNFMFIYFMMILIWVMIFIIMFNIKLFN
uniref:NADH-ubiquinone oxidoreductase chain 5 n=1 Tax=Xenopsylla cheopis TaxID=163159 RepID=A0A8F6AGH2_XENCH|nr:NADH dehydrogenase subunit 5 [Xenopsylla cheopis]